MPRLRFDRMPVTKPTEDARSSSGEVRALLHRVWHRGTRQAVDKAVMREDTADLVDAALARGLEIKRIPPRRRAPG